MFARMNNSNEWSWYCNELSELKCMIADLKWAYIHKGTLSKHNYMMKVAYDFNPLMYKNSSVSGEEKIWCLLIYGLQSTILRLTYLIQST
jgi:hypothetical protein